jgi:hypothetical protein
MIESKYIYIFDIDGTICTKTAGDYKLARPLTERIVFINGLYENGNKVYFHTARGMGRNNNNASLAREQWEAFTRNQLLQWGAKFHDIFFGKPSGDFYVDDKGISDYDFFKNSQ